MAGFEWGGKFWGPGDQQAFSKWLSSRGANYDTWAGRHPTAAQIFGGGAGGVTTGGVPGAAAGGGQAAANPGTIDYRSMIDSDPWYGQAKADLAAEGISDATQRQNTIRQALIKFGLVPDLQQVAGSMGMSGDALGFLGSDVDDNTRQLADKATQEGLSLAARMEKAYGDNVRSIKNQLAARGMVQSGEAAHQLGEEANRFKLARHDAQSDLMDYVTGVYQAFTQSERQRQERLRQQMIEAEARARANYRPGDGQTESAASGPMGVSSGPDFDVDDWIRNGRARWHLG